MNTHPILGRRLVRWGVAGLTLITLFLALFLALAGADRATALPVEPAGAPPAAVYAVPGSERVWEVYLRFHQSTTESQAITHNTARTVETGTSGRVLKQRPTVNFTNPPSRLILGQHPGANPNVKARLPHDS